MPGEINHVDLQQAHMDEHCFCNSRREMIPRLVPRLPWLDNVCHSPCGVCRLTLDIASPCPLVGEPRGILHVQASGRQLEFRHGARLLVGLGLVLDVFISSQPRVRPNIGGRKACLQRQYLFFFFETAHGMPNQPSLFARRPPTPGGRRWRFHSSHWHYQDDWCLLTWAVPLPIQLLSQLRQFFGGS